MSVPSRRRLAALSLLTLLSACSLRPDAGAAGAAAEQFHDAVAAADGPAACALLAPGTRHELEASSGEPCATAIVGEDLPRVSCVRDVDAYVRGARVVLDGDVVFVALYGDAWLVRAAGCVRSAGTSYDCTIEGG